MADISVISNYIAAAASLGTASFALVDTSKAFAGGVSNCGFKYIRRAVSPFATDPDGPLGLDAMLANLRGNWLNGTPLAGQKAIAKSLIKLRLNAGSVDEFARLTGVSAALLRAAVEKYNGTARLKAEESDANGRFDAALTAILDGAYQRADQSYRNSAKAWSVVVSIVMALVGCLVLEGAEPPLRDLFGALLVGLAATPIAPVAKDLTSALQAGVKVAQLVKK